MDQRNATADILGKSSDNVSRIRPVAGRGQDDWTSGRPEVPRSTIVKLVIFTILMFSLPILTYYWVLANIFDNKADVVNTSWSALAAALMANVVVIGYVIMAFLEPVPYTPLPEKKKA
ncbi:hypothetical protein DFJ74DRAFT_707564 [Hyaloraphidium curvatum]|nr:hypothetical protein DFJ74DRAFT_707564 [Hyaloraphidium curvatum]